MKNSKWAPLVACFTLGCGSTSGVLSCKPADSRTCVEYSWTGASGPGLTCDALDNPAASCARDGGTWGHGCSHIGSVGGCQAGPFHASQEDPASCFATTWYYAGDAQAVQASCTGRGLTFLPP